MKNGLFYVLAAVLVMGGGCKKKNQDGTTQTMTAGEMADKTQQTAVKATAKAAEVTKQATAAVSAFTVKAEDVMGDLNKTVDEVKAKVAGFDKTQVMAYADAYKGVLLEKKGQLAGITDKLKGLSPMDMLGDKGKALKAELTKYTGQFNGLKERYSVYLDQLKAFGVDLSAYGI